MENSQTAQLRILVVDDEQDVLEVYRQILSFESNTQNNRHEAHDDEKDENCSVDEDLMNELFGDPVTGSSSPNFEFVFCHQGDEAVQTVKDSIKESRPFSVIFMDVHMPPGSDGIWAAEHIRALDARVEIVMVAEDNDVDPHDIIYRVPPSHKLLYLQKPFHLKEIGRLASVLCLKWQEEFEIQSVHEQLERWIEERTAELMGANEQLAGEIEERKRVEDALRKSEERHRIVLEAVPDPVVVYDQDGRVTYLNPAFSKIFGWTLDEIRGRRPNFVPHEHLLETSLMLAQIVHGEIISGIETRRLTKNGDRVDVSISGAGFFDSDSRLQGSVITLQDISERKKTEEEIRYIAYHDILTGLPNRKSFYMRLEDKLLQSRIRPGEQRRIAYPKWALLFLDLDRFKYVNDTLGHDIGDELLKVVSDRLHLSVRKSDYIFRLGGDEFTIILNDLAEDTDVAKVSQKIRDEVAQPYNISEHELYITVSIGISVYPIDGQSVEKLVKNADMAMYAAKEEHHGYRFFTEEMNRDALERMKMESNMRTALQENQFSVYYQPLVDHDGQVSGMEALLRWFHPELGLISPTKFIPVAEETGAIVQIGTWVLHTACQQTKEWHDMGYDSVQLAVNLSTRQFSEADLVETVEQVLEKTGLLPECLKLEVTESGIMENPEQTIAKMKILRTKGIRFAIDDFGTGYSSLSYLKRFPIDTLKIDRSFVIDSSTNRDDQEIIKTIISMARNLSMDTVAEGVETAEQLDFLISQGCHIMQGYYFGRPMTPEKFEDFLQVTNSAEKKV